MDAAVSAYNTAVSKAKQIRNDAISGVKNALKSLKSGFQCKGPLDNSLFSKIFGTEKEIYNDKTGTTTISGNLHSGGNGIVTIIDKFGNSKLKITLPTGRFLEESLTIGKLFNLATWKLTVKTQISMGGVTGYAQGSVSVYGANASYGYTVSSDVAKRMTSDSNAQEAIYQNPNAQWTIDNELAKLSPTELAVVAGAAAAFGLIVAPEVTGPILVGATL